MKAPPGEPLWEVLKTYHWTQTFPARKALHIRHEYQPSTGFAEMRVDEIAPSFRKKRLADLKSNRDKSLTWTMNLYQKLDNACVDPSVQRELTSQAGRNHTPEEDVLFFAWVDYILTTANSWQTPIKDFTLIVDRKPDQRSAVAPEYISFCWDGPIKKVDAEHFLVHKTNFIPKKELQVAFLGLISDEH